MLLRGLLRVACALPLLSCSSESSDATTGGSDAGGRAPMATDAGGADAAPASAADSGAGSGASPALVEGCPGEQVRDGIDDDPSVRGPWAVGAVTTMLGGIPTEVWYPAAPGSEAGVESLVYDIREHLPEADRDRIPDERNPVQSCDCYAELPIDAQAGPYPVVLFIHGTAGFRTTNLEIVTLWASRGFVVVSSDHPGIRLRDMLGSLGSGPMADQAGDARRVLSDLEAPSGAAAFLEGHVDLARVGVMGHSAGARAASSLGDAAEVLIPYAGGDAVAVDRVVSTLHVTGAADTVVSPSTESYDGSSTPTRRYVSIRDGGHLVGASLCLLRDPDDPANDILDLATEFGIGGPLAPLLPTFFGLLFQGCNELPEDSQPYLPASRGIEILGHVTTAQLEETLHCSAAAGSGLAAIEERFGEDIAAYAETLPREAP